MSNVESFFTAAQLDELSYSDGYADYIMDNCHGERIICNGDTLIEAMEDGYLFESYLDTLIAARENQAAEDACERSVDNHMADVAYWDSLDEERDFAHLA